MRQTKVTLTHSTARKSLPGKPASRLAPAPEPPEFRRLYKALAVPRSDQPTVSDCLMLGVARFHEHVYGAPARRALEKLAARISEPYIFGFGAVEVARNETASLDTRLKFTQHALRSFDATAEYGIPHGLPILASFLAQVDALQPDLLRMMLITAGFAGAMFDDWQMGEVQTLLQWLIDRVDMPKAERLWWLWQITINCEDTRAARQIAEWLIAHAEIGSKSKIALCQAWLDDTAPGEPPAQWQALQSLLQGDVQGFVTHSAEAGVPADESISRAEIEADYDAALDALIDETDEDSNLPVLPLQLLRKTLVGPLGDVVYTPSILKHVALTALPTLGNDPVVICRAYLGEERRPHGATYNLGIAEVIRAQHSRIPRPALKKLVTRGLKVGGVATRRAFYQLGVELFGAQFWRSASQDESKSIRDWAKQKATLSKR